MLCQIYISRLTANLKKKQGIFDFIYLFIRFSGVPRKWQYKRWSFFLIKVLWVISRDYILEIHGCEWSLKLEFSTFMFSEWLLGLEHLKFIFQWVTSRVRMLEIYVSGTASQVCTPKDDGVRFLFVREIWPLEFELSRPTT